MKPRQDWPAIRAAFETEVVTQREIGERFGVTPRAIRDRAGNEGWVRCAAAVAWYRQRRPSPGRAAPARLPLPPMSPSRGERLGGADVRALVHSLQRTTARLVEAAELRFAGAETAEDGDAATATGIDEKDLRTLGALAAMLAKVIALDASPRSPRDDHSAASPAHGHNADQAETGDKVDFDDPRQRDAFSERLERFAAERAAGDAVAADRVGAPEP